MFKVVRADRNTADIKIDIENSVGLDDGVFETTVRHAHVSSEICFLVTVIIRVCRFHIFATLFPILDEALNVEFDLTFAFLKLSLNEKMKPICESLN